MHLYIATRGQKDKVDRFISDLQAIYLPYEYQKGMIGHIQMGVRPLQLWEITFPEPQKEKALQYIAPNKSNWNKFYDKIFKTIAKLLGLKPLTKDYDPRKAIPTRYNDKRFDIEVMGIGTKKDRYIDGIEQI